MGPKESSGPAERQDTDRSLDAERQKTDDELVKIGRQVAADVDDVVRRAREDADETQRAHRLEAAVKLKSTGASAAMQAATIAEQVSADHAVTVEREATDAERDHERDRYRHAITSLLNFERSQTDKHLTVERTQADEALVRILAQLAEAVRLRDDFLSVASHELNTPLTPIVLGLQLLAKTAALQPDSAFAEQVNAYVVAANRQVQRLSALAAELLDVSRLASGAPTVNLEAVDFGAVVRNVVARYRLQIEQAGCSLAIDAPLQVIGHWDALRLDQTVSNLLENAVKFAPGKAIRVRLQATSDLAQLSVEDEGIGIPAEDVPRIFGRFERAVSERNYGGLGLGLYICRANVEAMGGTIAVQSNPGRGSTFVVVVPLAGPG